MKKSSILLAILLSLITAAARVHKLPQSFMFAEDQEDLSLRVKQLVIDKQPTLISAKFSRVGMYLPPGYLYFLAPFFLLSQFHPYAAVAAVTFLAGVTALLLYLSAYAVSSLSGGLGSLPQSVAATAGGIFGGLFQFILVVVISFYLAVQPRGIESFLRLVTPVQREGYVLGLWQRSQQKIGAWMQGQLLLGLIIGVLVFLGLTIFNVEHALLLAILAAAFELIPFFGPVLAAVPAVMIAFSSSVTLGLVMIGFYIIIQQFENHLIYPLVVRKIIGVPPLVVILSLIVGTKLAGFMGLIIAVPVATVLLEILSDFEKSKYLFRKTNV